MILKTVKLMSFLTMTFGISQGIDADTLSTKEKIYFDKISNSEKKGRPISSVYVPSVQEEKYLSEKNALLLKHGNLSSKEKEDLIAEHKKNYFGDTDFPVNSDKMDNSK